MVIAQTNQGSETLSIAILLRTREDETLIFPYLPSRSIRLHRDMTTWQVGAGLWYGTYHAAKGLEFDMVVLPFCSSERLPNPDDVAAFGEEDAIMQDGHLLYVGVTRAKTRLIMTYSGEVTRLLPREQGLYARVKL